MQENRTDIADEKSNNITKRKTKTKVAKQKAPQEEILPHLSGMSDAWRTFYRAVAKTMKSE